MGRPPRAPIATEPSGPVAVATCVWSQYFPEDHRVGAPAPGDARGAQYFAPVSEGEGRFKAALAFRDCFRDAQQWAPLVEPVRAALL